MSDAPVSDDQLRLFIERIERLEEEKKGISDDIRDVYLESKSQGYDPQDHAPDRPPASASTARPQGNGGHLGPLQKRPRHRITTPGRATPSARAPHRERLPWQR
jgi:hypothetical protein